RKIRIVEPQGRPERPLNSWIRCWPLMGPMTLATMLDERGYDAAVVNENISGPAEENDRLYAELCSADIVGISIMTPTARRGYALADRLRRDAPDVRIVFGGVHATFRAEEALQHGDIVVCGEGETVIERIARGEITSGIVKAEPVADLDALPTPNHFLIRDFDVLLSAFRKRALYPLPVMTSRGCPHGCTYCCVTRLFGRRIRAQSAERVDKALKTYADQGFRRVFFYDDNFTADLKRTRKLLEMMRPLRMTFNAQVRADFHRTGSSQGKPDRELLKSMRRAGGDMLYIGYETVDDETARGWHKGYRDGGSLSERLRDDTAALHDHGFWIHGMFVLGPHHTRKTANGIVDFALKCGVETIQISALTPFPGTPLMEQMRPHLVFDNFPDDWDYYDGTHVLYDNTVAGFSELQWALYDAHKRFYRFGGWSGRALRSIGARPATAVDKVAEIVAGAKTAWNMLRRWRGEIDQFLALAAEKGACERADAESPAGRMSYSTQR
ncbi:MAG: B12-binding domain-containing radical SAM protein, partial [Phycisphaerae bacterium]